MQTLQLPTYRTLDQLIQNTGKALVKAKLVKTGDYIVIVTGQPVAKSGGLNLVKLHQI